MGEVVEESNSENENNQEIVTVVIDSDRSEDDNTKPKIKALPNSSSFTDLMTKTLKRLMSSSISLKIKSTPYGASNLRVLLYTLGGDRIRMNDNVYDKTPEIHKALSSTSSMGRTMKNKNDVLTMNNIIRHLGYTGRRDRQSNGKSWFTKTLPKYLILFKKKLLTKVQTTLMIYKEKE